MKRFSLMFFTLLVSATVLATAAYAQEGTLKVSVKPKTGYVFVDGRAIGQGNQTVRLAAGTHRLNVYNYGHRAEERSVDIAAGQTARVEVTLTSTGESASGPWGRIRISARPDRAAVLLNGKTPEFTVACSGATDYDFLVKQELLVRPGTHQVTLVLDGYRTYTASVTVGENERVEIRQTLAPGSGEETIPAAAITTKPEERLAKIGTVPKAKVGAGSFRFAVVPLTAQFAATPTQIRCGESARLSWSTTEALKVEISGIGAVTASGEQLVEPKQITTYNFSAAGHGGVAEQSATINVDAAVKASLNVSPASMEIVTLDGEEQKRGQAQLSWSSDNADKVELTPFGAVSASGSRTVSPDQTTTYTLRATNVCGGSETLTAALNVTRQDLVTPEVQLAALFFPTDWPDKNYPSLGLLRSQARVVELLAKGFADYLKVRPNGRLRLEANADERASVEHNQALAQRRGEIVKQRLVDAGVPSANIDLVVYGEERPLEQETVTTLEKENPNPAPQARARAKRVNWLAHNRRVDVVLVGPKGGTGIRYYPHAAEDSDILWRYPKPPRTTIEKYQ